MTATSARSLWPPCQRLEPMTLVSNRYGNPNEIFVATDQPFGVIEATVKR